MKLVSHPETAYYDFVNFYYFKNVLKKKKKKKLSQISCNPAATKLSLINKAPLSSLLVIGCEVAAGRQCCLRLGSFQRCAIQQE